MRGWPGVKHWRPPLLPESAGDPRWWRLWQRPSLVFYAAAALDIEGRPVMPEKHGLSAALICSGATVNCGCLIVDDDLHRRDPGAFDAVCSWAAANPPGPAPWQQWTVVTLSEFFDPFATVEAVGDRPAKPWAFTPTAYTGAGFVIGADLGRTFGLVAEHVSPRRSRAGHVAMNAGEWNLWLPDWAVKHANGWKPRSPHRPYLTLRSRRVGWSVEFGPVAGDNGKHVGGRIWRGVFLDVMSLAYAFDAQRGSSLVEHAENFGVQLEPLPLAVTIDGDGASKLARAVADLHALSLRLDAESGRWFTTSTDRAEGRGRIDVARTTSPGTLAAGIVNRARLRAPLQALALDETELRRWIEAFHGGWCDADPRTLGVPFLAGSLDVSSCFPLVAHLIGWWDLYRAEGEGDRWM
jgi:hypothetical protein